jgi:hypothetical protein
MTLMTQRAAMLGGKACHIAAFPVLPGVTKLRILAEAGDASERAVAECSQRWLVAGKDVFVVRPRGGLSDLNDELLNPPPDGVSGAHFVETCQVFWPGATLVDTPPTFENSWVPITRTAKSAIVPAFQS